MTLLPEPPAFHRYQMPRDSVLRLFVWLAAAGVCAAADPAQGTGQPIAVPTFHCIGLYWSPDDGSAQNACAVRYRPAAAQRWNQAMPLWFDERTSDKLPAEHRRQYRGSIVNLTPGTDYEIELSLEKTARRASIRVRTWSENFPIGQTVVVQDANRPLIADKSGSPNGYVLYEHPQDRGTATIDVENKHKHCVEVRASFVILRGLTLKNAQQHGIRIFENCHDIVIEGCDISGWGRSAEDGWGRDYDSAVYSQHPGVKRVIVQRNYMHHPRSNSNNWRQSRPAPGKRESTHPEGPQIICLWDSEGNHVFRYNTVDSDDSHYYNDAFGAGHNFSVQGFPNRDSDIYGNRLSHCWDDTIESEGANCNVRIWGNYSTDCYVAIACASTSVGPLYVWRNISGTMAVAPGQWGGGFLKTSDNMGGGKIFVYHNTILQILERGSTGTIATGARTGLGWGGPMVNVTSRNNILHVTQRSFQVRNDDPLSDFDYDLYTGPLPSDRHEKHGIVGTPIYAEGQPHALAENSPGHDAGARLPNFNDDFRGAGPDMGAEELGSKPLEFGVDAYRH